MRPLPVLAVAALGCLGLSLAAAAESFPASAGKSFRDGADGPEMIVLPTGQFLMGSPANEKYRFDNEGPQHLVRVDHAIAMSKYPVTAGQLAAWTGAAPKAGEENYPAVMVTWFDARDYAGWLSKKTGHTYRLPTEAEYEYAERAGTTTPYYWGRQIGKSNANCIGCGSPLDGTGSTKVGSFAPNAFGLFDMAGNVFEWVEDCYVDNFDVAPDEAHVARQSVNGECAMRTLRASSWFNLPSFLRSAYRFRELPGAKNLRRGFRVVREGDPAP